MRLLQPIFDAIERELGGGQVITMNKSSHDDLELMMMFVTSDDDYRW